MEETIWWLNVTLRHASPVKLSSGFPFAILFSGGRGRQGSILAWRFYYREKIYMHERISYFVVWLEASL